MDQFRVRTRGTTRVVTVLIGDLKEWYTIEALAKAARDASAQLWIEKNVKPFGLLGQQGMVMSANATRSGKAAIVKYAVTGTQFQQLLRTYRIFILSGVSQPEFVADVAPHFQDFDVVSPKITTLEGFMQWVDECDPGRNPSPCSSERSARCEVTSPGSISLASSGRSSSVFELESNDALSPGGKSWKGKDAQLPRRMHYTAHLYLSRSHLCLLPSRAPQSSLPSPPFFLPLGLAPSP